MSLSILNTMPMVKTAISVFILGASAISLSPSFAASACKGLEQSECVESTSCGWVNSYTRKDGRTVNAFCRTKAKKKAQTATSGSEKNEAKAAS